MLREHYVYFRRVPMAPDDLVPLREPQPAGWDDYGDKPYWSAKTECDEDCPKCVAREAHTWREHDEHVRAAFDARQGEW